MGMFDGFAKKAEGARDTAVQAAKDAQETAKLNASIKREKEKIEKVYMAIGERYFSKFQNAPGEGFEELVGQINTSLAEIEDCTAKIRTIKGVVLCENCGAEVPADQEFCGSCGAKIKKAEPVFKTESDDMLICRSCGAKIVPRMRFCTNCGSPVEKPAENEPEQGKTDACTCPKCGAELAPDAKFCVECGAPVE